MFNYQGLHVQKKLKGPCSARSSSGKLATFGFGHPNGGNIQWFLYHSPTSFRDNVRSAGERNAAAGHFFRARLVDTDIEMLASPHGVGKLALTTAFTTAPDQSGIFLEPINTNSSQVDPHIDVVHWRE